MLECWRPPLNPAINLFASIWAQPSTAQLIGPEFTQPATELSHKAGVGSISVLQVYAGTGVPNVQSLDPALGILRNYFSIKALIVLYLDQHMISPALVQQLQETAGVPVTFGVDDSQTMQTMLQGDAQQQQQERWKIQQDTQLKIFEIQQDVTQNKSKTSDNAYKSWDQYIRG